ncbi:MAG: polysaccharide deacetylase family protein [Lachnospiraceae bacterium]|nr:polysaccharide deacetylase family protein [Lachnospiraceae bacterium]
MERKPKYTNNRIDSSEGSTVNRRTSPSDASRKTSSETLRPDRQRPSSTSKRTSAGQRPSASAPTRKKGSSATARRIAARKRKQKQRRMMLAAAAAVLIIIVAILLIVFTSRVPEAKNLTIKSTDNSQVLTWERNGKEISYEVYRKGSEGDFSLVRTIGEEDATTYTAESLSSATLYKYKVVAVKGHKKSKGAVIEDLTTPVIAANLTANTQVEKSLTLVWDDSQAVNGYDLKFGSANDLSDATTTTVSLDGITVDETTGLRSYTYDELEEGAIYYFSIRSFCDKDKYSDWTPIVSARVTRAIDMSGIDPSAPMVAITFDDGPDGSDVTTRILDAFAEAGGHATFFQLGDHAEAQPEKIKRMVAEGHEVGNHTYDHTHMSGAVTSDDIIRANNSIEEVCGIRPYSFRCPGGESTDLIVDTCISEGMSVFHWSLDTRDWSRRDADAVIAEIKNNVQDGDIILMHNIYSSTADAVEQILPWLTDQGYQLVTVSQLLQAKNGEPPLPGITYKRADYSW